MTSSHNALANVVQFANRYEGDDPELVVPVSVSHLRQWAMDAGRQWTSALTSHPSRERMIEVLRPFAAKADDYGDDVDDSRWVGTPELYFEVADFRKARTLLAELEAGGEKS